MNKRLFLSIRVVSADAEADAIEAVRNGEFIDSHELSDAIIPMEEYVPFEQFENLRTEMYDLNESYARLADSF